MEEELHALSGAKCVRYSAIKIMLLRENILKCGMQWSMPHLNVILWEET